MAQERSRRFAFGDWSLDDEKGEACGCPIDQAMGGLQTGSFDGLADNYDIALRKRTGSVAGIVSEEVAKEVWLASMTKMVGPQRRLAEGIARKLGWTA